MAKLSELHEQWERDAEINQSQLDEAVRRIPKLHSQWMRRFTDERHKYFQLKARYQQLYKEKWEYIMGKMSDERLKELGWDPQPLRVPPQKVDLYLDADTELLQLSTSMEMSELKVKFIEDVLKMLHTRGYQIKTMVDFLRFTKGDY